MTRIAQIVFTAALGFTSLSIGGANATTLPPGKILGGLNLTGYCQAVHGAGFKAVALGNGAGDWACQRNVHDRRPISVQRACEMQYGVRPVKAITVGLNDAGSWRCFQPRAQRPVYNPPNYGGKVLGGLNLTAYCQASFGHGFKAITVGTGAGDWTCAKGAHNRRPISVQTACEMQYKARPIKAVALDQANAGSWVCKAGKTRL
jgi:hypothetical protein